MGPLGNTDDLILRQDRSVQRVLEGDNLGWSTGKCAVSCEVGQSVGRGIHVHIRAFYDVGLNILQGEVVTYQ
jgi:hypothetical protein